ncbi:8-oxoguanine deaminase [Actinomadura parmotrematis]|uniref:8-oxoguanine deaminase n=1 Tax=Actinomadura parmotrematis TaxID=2864039 RepID=A0ABS7FW15_9ACTN|nr:8-oxoguanine deaminase [Actinomadura parmotrematis]MBW8484360.1 8-oxoguanine deaminase [Actinomadura parmotrematis]
MSDVKIIEGAHVVTVTGAEHPGGHIVVTGDRITAVGAGPAPAVEGAEGAERIDGTGCLATPGLVNTHHHLYQWASQGYAPDHTLFEWLTTLYRPWAKMDAEVVAGAASAGLGWLAKSGCTTSTDHHYIFPKGRGDLFAAEIDAAAELGVRFHPCRGSMDLGRSQGGLPPDEVVEDLDTILAETEAAIDRHHDASFGSMLRIAVAPCSPFSVTKDLLVRSAELARARGVRLHTHLAETTDEEDYTREHFGATPVEYMDSLGWLGPDVWLAHCVHLHDSDIARLAATGTGTAHCPSSNARLGSGIARVAELLAAGAPVGLGVDGAASAELVPLGGEIKQAVYMQRARSGPRALTARQALEIATIGGARCLGREAEIGSLEPGKLADIALWDVGGFHAAIDDPVLALAAGGTPPLRRLLVGGRTVVADDALATVAQDEVARRGAAAHRRLMTLAEEVL